MEHFRDFELDTLATRQSMNWDEVLHGTDEE
jgi:hypothetical protein